MTDWLVFEINKISGLTNEEWVKLKSTLFAIDQREFICGECLNKYNGRQDQEMMTQKLRESKGCEVISQNTLHRIGSDIEFKTCVGNFFDSSVVSFLKMHRLFELGILPFAGSAVDQPSKVMDIFNTIDNYKADKQEDQKKKQEMVARRKTRGR